MQPVPRQDGGPPLNPQQLVAVTVGGLVVLVASFLQWAELPLAGGESLVSLTKTVGQLQGYVSDVPAGLMILLIQVVPLTAVLAWTAAWWPSRRSLDGVVLAAGGVGLIASLGVVMGLATELSAEPGPIVAAVGSAMIVVGAVLPFGETTRPLPLGPLVTPGSAPALPQSHSPLAPLPPQFSLPEPATTPAPTPAGEDAS